MPYVRLRTCTKCNKVDTIRKDSKAIMCRPCANSVSFGTNKGQKRAARTQCIQCGIDVLASKNQKFCSRACEHIYVREIRHCKYCLKQFAVLSSTLKTNASGNYCGTDCYHKSMITDTKKGRGSQWKKSRKAQLSKCSICIVCGTNKNLQVHHVVPFTKSFDNSPENLVTLCAKDHYFIESVTKNVYKTVDAETASVFLNSAMLEFKQIIYQRLKKAKYDIARN